jgi:hypothetical protein
MTNGYSSKLLKNKNITDAITSLNPFSSINVKEKFKANSSIGRFYIGCIPLKKYNKDIAICKNILFFYSTKATHYEMINVVKKWGVENNFLMAMDGSGSAQMYSDMISNEQNLELYGVRALFPDFRDLSGIISLYSK